MTETSRALRIQALIAFMCLALLLYLFLLGRTAVILISSQRIAGIGLGIALLLLPIVGLWALIVTLRAGFTHQRLARLIATDRMELDTSALPRRRSGRIERKAADALFDTVRHELHNDPDDWRCWYRLARAYDYAGDRRRAREAMKNAVVLQGRS
jgi:cytochrome c-type biogenesis protein CcmH/NrfG